MVRMKVVIVGAGASGLLHALSFRACGVAIAGVYDPDTERARTLADLSGGRVLASFEDAVRSDATLAAILKQQAGTKPVSLVIGEPVAIAELEKVAG